nr:YchJ family metal-binding protein [Azohydromonas sediminis]
MLSHAGRRSRHLSSRVQQTLGHRPLPEPQVKWLGLEVRRHTVLDADHATVEFVARSRLHGRGQRLHETSRFVREDGRWYYVDGDVR